MAVQIVVNYEEGSEKSFPMGDEVNDVLHEIPFQLDGIRDLCVESVYEYGSRAGIWRLFRVFDAAGIPVTFFAAAVALERNPDVAAKLAARGDEAAGHGFRWSNHFEMTREEEREAIRLGIESIERTVGTRPVGWYCREMSVNTRELLVEEGGFFYDSECYNDDLPYWTRVQGQPHLVVPYTLIVNDARYVLAQGYGSPEHFYEYAKASDGSTARRRRRLRPHDVDRTAPALQRSAASLRRPRSLHRLRPGPRRRCFRCGGSTSPRASPSRCPRTARHRERRCRRNLA